MPILAQRVVQRYLTARYTKPRGMWPDDEANAYAVRITKEAEQHGHDLGPWKNVRKGERWKSECVNCNMRFEIDTRGNNKYSLIPNEHYSFGTWLPSLIREDWATDRCNVEPRDYIRGMFIEMKDPAAVLNQSPAGVKASLLRLLQSRPLGTHWTKPTNKTVALAFSGWASKLKEDVGIPVVIHAQYRRDDQKRNYKHAPKETSEEFYYEEETFLGAGEILRLQSVEWYDGEKWQEVDLGGAKAKA